MAKSKSNKKAVARYDALPIDEAFLAQLGTPFTLMQAKNLLKMAWANPSVDKDGKPAFAQPWDPEFTTSYCPCLVSEPGEGKSIIIETLAMELEMEYRRIPMGDSMEEDSMGVVNPDKKDDQGHHLFSLPPWMPVDAPCGGRKGGRGVTHFDECGTGTSTHQNLFSTLLTAGYRTGIFGHVIKPGWFLAASMNPESAKYHLNQALDPRVRDRLFVIHVKSDPAEVLHYLGRTNKLPPFMYGFLMLHYDKTDVMGAISARSWEMLGAFGWRYHDSGAVSKADFMRFVRGKMPKGTAELLNQYFSRGDDPDMYPMSTQSIVEADDATHLQHVQRMRTWNKKQEDSLIAATAYDIARYFKDVDFKFSDKAFKQIIGIVEGIRKTDLMSNLLNSCVRRADLAHRVVEYVQDTDAQERVAGLLDRRIKIQQKENER